MGKPGRRKRVARWVAAWAVAYVLVLQAFLAGIVSAAVLADASATLCLNAGEPGASGGGHPGLAANVHCQACLARVDQPASPPPCPSLTERIALELRCDFVARTALRSLEGRPPFQPRGPPSSLLS